MSRAVASAFAALAMVVQSAMSPAPTNVIGGVGVGIGCGFGLGLGVGVTGVPVLPPVHAGLLRR